MTCVIRHSPPISPETPPISPEKPSFVGRIERGVREMYAEDDLGGACLFAGGFINFGYWPTNINLQNRLISLDERLASQQEMYRQVSLELDIAPEHVVVEVGSGRGVGAALIAREFRPKSLTGVDFCKEQIVRALTINSFAVEQGGVNFVEGDATKLPFADGSVDRIYSVEAAQHFPSVDGFLIDAARVLRSNGRICCASFFGCHDMASKNVAPLIQTVDAGIDRLPSIRSIQKLLAESGFIDVVIQPIGKHVWNGFDRWVSQTALNNSWTRNWKVAYESGDVDYYLIKGTKE